MMQTWSVPLQVFSILKHELPDIDPTQYMKHLDRLPIPTKWNILVSEIGLSWNGEEGLVDAISHVFIKHRPGTSEYLLKYMPTVQYGRLWNDFYRQCRGTVIDMSKMVAWHSFDKFFNIDEMPYTSTEHVLRLAECTPFNVYSKYDGSLIMFYCNGDWRTSTNGSFESEQAQWAMEFAKRTGLLRKLHADYTYMFEAIYPSNRIVVNYGDAERLVLLSVRSNKTGHEESPSHWVVDSVRDDHNKTIAQLLAERDKYPATEKEGWVVHFPKLQLRVKVKCADYIAVHRLKEHITPEGVFEMIRTDTLDDVRSALPSDIRVEVDAIVRQYVDWERDLRQRVESIHVDDVTDNKATFMAVRDVFPNGTFEQWYALRYVRGQIDTQRSPLMYVTTFDKVRHIFDSY